MIRGMTAPSFMDLALKTAENAGKAGEVPIGCVIVRGYEVIATAGNRTLTDRDPTAHAEILALRQAAEAIGTERLVDCDLYVTLEPCTMCAGAISLSRIRRLYYGAADPKGGAVDSGVRFFASPTCHHVPEVYSAVGETEAASLLRDFFKVRRGVDAVGLRGAGSAGGGGGTLPGPLGAPTAAPPRPHPSPAGAGEECASLPCGETNHSRSRKKFQQRRGRRVRILFRQKWPE